MTSNILETFAMQLKQTADDKVLAKESHEIDYKWRIVWRNTIIFIYIHFSLFYGLYIAFFYANFRTFIWNYAIGLISGLGTTAGSHRLWCHRCYKAKLPLRFILMIFQTVSFQNNIYDWVRDHRVHHKFTDTDADPYNARRGFFFSHIGWLMLRKHPDVTSKGATIDTSDLDKDPLVIFQKRYYTYLTLFFSFIIPVMVPWWIWGENLWYAWTMAIGRYCIILNMTWSVNSVAHIWGVKPYDKSITPTDNANVSFLSLGEGWHNYHHVFPWDYKAAEFGNYGLNFTTFFIDFCAYLGLAYDLKTTSAVMVKKRILRNNEMSY